MATRQKKRTTTIRDVFGIQATTPNHKGEFVLTVDGEKQRIKIHMNMLELSWLVMDSRKTFDAYRRRINRIKNAFKSNE